jgi:hypothetical protein
MVVATAARAEFPDYYKPVAVEPPFSFTERVFDLTPAFARAQVEGKPMFVYVGAYDCPPCKDYERFIQKHRADLEPAFQNVVIVDIRTWLKGPKFIFKIGEKRFTLSEFRALVGDQQQVFTYPYYWLLSTEPKQLRQLPLGSRHYMDVERHKSYLLAK